MAPFVPMLFMGEEYGERAPFQFFTDHIDPVIADATREGRRRELAELVGFDEDLPDPQDPATHRRSLLDRSTRDEGLSELYRRLLELRPRLPQETPAVMYHPDQGWVWMDRGPFRVVGNFSDEPADVPVFDRRELVVETVPGAVLQGRPLRLSPLGGAVLR
jgi:maltooligosyltrehalose trehalohydrolase